MGFPHGETIVVHRPTESTDRYGNTLRAHQPSHTVGPCAVWSPTTDDVAGAGRDGQEVDLVVLTPPTPAVAADDRVEVRGDVYDVVGEPHDYLHPMSGWAPGCRLLLRRVEG